MQPYQQPYQPPPGHILLPPAFASRVRGGSIALGVVMLLFAPCLFGVTRFFDGIAHSEGLNGAVELVIKLVPSVILLATGFALLSTRRCLAGDLLIIEKARRQRKIFLGCLTAMIVACVLQFVPPIVERTGGAFLTAFLGSVVYLAVGIAGAGVGMFYVRPDVHSLQRFAGSNTVW